MQNSHAPQVNSRNVTQRKMYRAPIASGASALFISCLIVLSFMERIYSPGQSSGSFNRFIYIGYALLGLSWIFLHYRTIKFGMHDAAMVTACLLFMIYSYDSRSILYGTILFGILALTKLHIADMRPVHRALVVLGLIFGILFCIGDDRWSGFLNNSAPVFSLIMLTSQTYLLFYPKATKFDGLLAVSALFLIAMTQTRATLLVGIVLIVGKIGGSSVVAFTSVLRRHKFAATILLIVLAYIVFSNLDFILSLVAREGGGDSNRTRAQLMGNILSQWVTSPQSFLFGHGGGFAMSYTALVNASFTGNLPVHQDVLMLLCDYGVIGVALLGFALVPFLRNLQWFSLLVLCMATFHNVFTSGACLMLLILSFQSLSLSIKSGGVDDE